MQDLQLLKPEDVARILRVAKVTPYQWARRGILPHYRLEGAIRFKLEDIMAFVEARRVDRKPPTEGWGIPRRKIGHHNRLKIIDISNPQESA